MSKLLKILGFTFVALALTVALAVPAEAAYMHTTTLKQGMSGSQVLELQKTLGVSPQTGYFGSITKAAVMAFQASKGLMADGVVGPATGAALAGSMTYYPPTPTSYPAGCSSSAGYSTTTGLPCSGSASTVPGCTSTSGYSPTTGAKCDGSSTTPTSTTLSGMNGEIDEINQLSQYTSEEVAEGTSDVKVLGFEVQASKDGDIQLKNLKLVFDNTGNASGDDDKLVSYLEKVTVWQGSEEVGSADAADFNKDSTGVYSKSIALTDAVVGSDETEKFYVSVDAVSSLDSGDIDSDSMTVAIDSLRYEDGSGVTTTVDSSDSLLSGNMDYDAAGDGVPLAFVSFSAASDTEFKFSSHVDNPEAGVIIVSDTGTTDDVLLLKGKIEAEGDSDIWMDSFNVTLAPTTSTFQSMVSSIKLMLDSEEYSESVPTIAAGATASLTFDDLDYTLGAGDTITFSLLVEVADIDEFTAGSTITASITSTNRENMDLENEQGDSLASGERSGTVGGEAQEFREEGIKVEMVGTPTASKSAVDADNGDTATFVIKFKVTALGSDVYVASVASPDGAMANAYTLDYSGTATTTDQSAAFVNNTDATLTSVGTYLIEEGESETFEMTVVRNASATDGLYRVSLTNIKWGTDSTDSTPGNTYTTELDEFKTPYVALD